MNGRIPLLMALAACAPVFGDEPIMNMMPRWSGGWGYQLIHEYRHERDLLEGSRKSYPGFTEDVNILHLEGVYTWERWIRLTAKLPYVLDARREMPDGSGGKKIEKDHGIGDLTLALPLKKYFNLDGRSGSWTLKPTLTMPMGSDDEYEVYDHEWGNGLEVAYETETANWHIHTSTGGWWFYGNEPFMSKSSIDIGYNINTENSNGTILWETDFLFEDDESKTLRSGPAFYWNLNDTTHLRLEWKRDFIDHQGTLDHGNGDMFRISLGWVF